ncbi:MAG: DUF3237 domain-containing protein [Pseudomonadales bacterium]|nr:DUF3237 domain-containing protein [Pseudomonadales bacterium]
MFDYTMEHICSYSATLRAPFETIGETPQGLRVNAYVTGGEVHGPRLRGRVLPVGGDWLTIRRDGMGVLDVRATLETHDGALIDVQYQGLLDLGADGYARMLGGDPPARAAIRATPRLMCAHPDYLWLNRLQCVNIGEADFTTAIVSYDVYAVR